MANKIDDAKLNKTLYEKYSTGQRADYVKAVANDRAYFNGNQIDKDIKAALDADDKFAIPINETTPAINQVVSFLTENDPRFAVTARENADVSVATDMSDLLSYIWYASEGNAHLHRGAIDFEVDGMGALMAYLDPSADWGKGEILIANINPLDLYIDPNSKDPTSKDAAHILVSYLMTDEKIKEMYPKVSLEDCEKEIADDYPESDMDEIDGVSLNTEDTGEDKYRLIDRYSKIKVQRYHIYDPNSQFEAIFDEDEYIEFSREPAVIVTKMGSKTQYITRKIDTMEMIDLARQTGGVYHLVIDPYSQQQQIQKGVEIGQPNEIPNSTTRLDIVTMRDLLEEGAIIYDTPKIDRVKRVFTIGGKEIYNEIMPISDYPIKTFMLHHNRNPFPKGDVRLVRPLQDQLNKVTELIITYNTNIANVKAFLPKGSGLKKDMEKRGGKPGTEYFEYDPDLGGVPIFVQLTQMSSALYQQRMEIIQQIQRIIGAYSFQDGNISSAPETKGGTLMMDEFGQRRINSKRKFIERALTQLAKVILEMVPYAYTERKIIRVIRPNRSPKEIVFNDPIEKEKGKIEIFNDITVGKYDGIVVAGSMLPTNRWAKLEVLERFYQQGILKDPTPILQHADLPDMEEILEREDLIKQYEQLMEQAEQEIKSLKGDLQTANRAEVQSRKKVEVIKTATQLKQIANKADAQRLIEKEKVTNGKKTN